MRLWVTAVILLIAVGAIVVGLAVWVAAGGDGMPPLLRGQPGSRRLLTVQEALRLCPAGMDGSAGAVTVRGYLARVRVAEFARTLQGLFPSREAALLQSRTVDPAYPPSNAAVWIRVDRKLAGSGNLVVTGRLDCITQRGGMGDNSGTFAWLTPRS